MASKARGKQQCPSQKNQPSHVSKWSADLRAGNQGQTPQLPLPQPRSPALVLVGVPWLLPCQHTLKAIDQPRGFKVKSAQALEGLELCPWREQSSSLGLRALQGHLGQGPFSALRLGQGCPWAQSSLCKASVQAPRDIWKSQTASTHEKLKSDDGLKATARLRPLCRTIISSLDVQHLDLQVSAALRMGKTQRHSAVFSASESPIEVSAARLIRNTNASNQGQ